MTNSHLTLGLASGRVFTTTFAAHSHCSHILVDKDLEAFKLLAAIYRP